MQPLAGKQALVTGGATGIGYGIAVALAQAGCRVGISGRRDDKLQQAARAYPGKPGLLTCRCDVADRQSVEQLQAWAAEQLPQLDILVNCAGVNIVRRGLAELSPEDWDQLMAVNATGAYNCLRAFLPAMRKRGDGLVINISSISGKRAGLLGGVAYNASKFALTALGITAAQEEAKYGIRVTNIYPGEVDTPILEHRPVPVSAEHRAKILQPEDVGAAVLMIACLPPRAHIAEMVIKPTSQSYM